jgi:3,4-dihydroxy 2-butanone 4-phosphate synthase / GTP cyclohydrolase II
MSTARALPFADFLSPIEEIVEDAQKGRMFILVDDESRENEGDLIIPAAHCTAETINFMAKHGRGLICLALSRQRVEALGLPLMAHGNESRMQTAFTVSIEAREGITTGISAADRARTVQVAIDPKTTRADLATPGHVFPLLARDGGVLVRAGHTEAAVDIARLAGLDPSGVVCEIMNDDGTMARLPDLVGFAQRHGLKVATIAELISYRLTRDRLVEPDIATTLHTRFAGDFRLQVYINVLTGVEHLALVKGDLEAPDPVLVRVHALNVLEDVLGQDTDGRGSLLRAAMMAVHEAGRGVLVLIREPSPTSVSERIRASLGQPAVTTPPLRDYGIGAQILKDLGVRDMILLSNVERPIVGLEGYDLRVVEQRHLPLREVGP